MSRPDRDSRFLVAGLPLLAFAVVAGAFALLGLINRHHERRLIEQGTELMARQASLRLEEYLQVRLDLVGRSRYLWHLGLIDEQDEFRRHAEGILGGYQGLIAVNWIDPAGFIRWVVPEGPNRAALGRDLKTHPGGAAATFLAARATGRDQITPPVTLLQGGLGIAAYFPIRDGEISHGYLNAVFRIGSLVDDCLASGIKNHYSLELWDGPDLAYRFAPDRGGMPFGSVSATSKLTVGGRTWTMTVAPRKRLLDQIVSPAFLALLLAGLLIGLLTAGLLRRALVSRSELRRTLEQHSIYVENAPDAIVAFTDDGKVLEVNTAAGRLTGRPCSDLPGLPVGELLTGLGQNVWPGLFATLRSGGPAAGEAELARADGSRLRVAIKAVTVGPGRHLAFVSDITDRQRLEEQLRQAQKMEAIGLLAGGVAHDFNNLLTAIFGHLELARRTLPGHGPVVEHLEGIRHATARAADLVRQLLTLGRRQAVARIPLDLDDLIERMRGMLQSVLGERIELTVGRVEKLPAVLADPGQLEQVIGNLALNARDTMPDGGQLVIETAEVSVDAGWRERNRYVGPDRCVRLRVGDTGCGMDEQTRLRVFEPFFTTKPVGRGTGLGLATVYGVVSQHGGVIEVDSKPGRGTIFTIHLPAAGEAVGPLPGPGGEKPAPGGSERILLVEDEPDLRRLASAILSDLGYRVFEAGCGEEAVRAMEQAEGRIDLLLSDVVMPGTSGPDLAALFRSRLTDLKVLFMSGYADGVAAGCGLAGGGDDLLSKPFSPDDLARRIREVLDRR